MVLAHDPSVKDQAIDFWELSRPHYDAVIAAFSARAEEHAELRDHYHARANDHLRRAQEAAPSRRSGCAGRLCDSPWWRDVIEPAVDCYLYAHKRGAFSKSWAVNAGAVNSPVTSQHVCVLDGDILVDREFAHRNAEWLRQSSHGAHLPFEWLFNLAEAASSWAIQDRVLERQPDVDAEKLRGFLKKGTPGACL